MGDMVYTSAAEIRILGGKDECPHEVTALKNYKEVTFEANGYTGDVVCENCENIGRCRVDYYTYIFRKAWFH